jgi:KipI family sensor histidine kinase inhibitor
MPTRREAPDRPAPTIVPFGDGALLVVMGDEIDPALSRLVHRIGDVVREALSADSAWGSPVPGFGSLLVPYDPLMLSDAEATGRLARLLPANPLDVATAPAHGDRALDIPVRYGGAAGPDLEDVAKALRLTPQRVVELHTANDYEVLLLGFAPGFAYMGVLPSELALPRRATPRPRVPPGSVAIAGRQTAVYPSATAGGWHIIGRTEVVPWDVARDPPALLRPGQRVRFRAVSS